MLPFDAWSKFKESTKELELALNGEDRKKFRCPKCDQRHIKEVRPGEWECPRCGPVEKQKKEYDPKCPYCGRRDLEINWGRETIECSQCGEIEI